MTATVIDEVVAPVQHVELPRAPQAPKQRREWPLGKNAKRAGLIALALILVYLVQTQLVAQVMFQQRQQHLAAEFKAPSPQIGSGEALGIVQIPAAGIDRAFSEDVTVDHLRSGPAHLAGSALPGDPGVMVIYGHRDGYGGPFENLSKVKGGDSVYAQARNGGPIVRYVVDRVERQSALSALTFDKTDLISYAVLVTSERGVFDNNQLIVVARALPVTDAAPTVPDLSAGVETEAPFGLESLLGVASAVAAVLCFRYLNGRTRDGVRVLATAPIAVFAAIQLMLLLDAILPLTR